jgi:hypothetical protein
MTTTHVGRQWPSAPTLSKDPSSGTTMGQLAHYRAQSNGESAQ